MISDYCRKRVAIVLSPLEAEAMRQYLTKLLELGISPTRLMGHDAWTDVSLGAGIPVAHLKAAHHQLGSIFDAVTRSVSRRGVTAKRRKTEPAIKGETDSSASMRLALTEPLAVLKREDAFSSKRSEAHRKTPVEEGPSPF